MRLTQKNVHLFLLEKGIIKAKSLVDGDYQITTSQTRNAIFKIVRKKEKSLFVKQLNSFDPTNTYVLQKDATSLWLIKNEKEFDKLSHFVPDYFGFDPEKQVLITEYIPNSLNLEDYVRSQSGKLKNSILNKLANILSSYHFKLSDKLKNSKSISFFPNQIPWVLEIAENPDFQLPIQSRTGSNPVVQAVKSNGEFLKVLRGIKLEWQALTLIHGDIKGMNFLIYGNGDDEVIKIIDWEIADIGDPLWDVAGIFANMICNHLNYSSQYLNVHFAPVPGISLKDISAVLKDAHYFWGQYKTMTKNNLPKDSISINKLIKYTGARLIQTAIEQNMMMPNLQPNAIKMLQASYAILSHQSEVISSFK